MKFTLAILILLPFFSTAQNLKEEFNNLIDSVYQANKDAVGILIHVESPDHKLSWTQAVGFSDSSKNEVLQTNQPVLIASNTKTYVAAAIIRLVEENYFSLEHTIEHLLTEKTRKLMEQSNYKPSAITLRHLLSHTSGIKDYVNDAYFEMLLQNPKKVWTRDEQIKRAFDLGDPLSDPGKAFHYADINYLLLTEIIEQTTKIEFYTAIRQLLKYEELDLKNTWFKELENTPQNTAKFAHQYALDFTCDSYNIHPSWDLYGGGGIASTVEDAAKFYQYLFEGKIIKNEHLLKEMTSYVLPKDSSKYCLGVYHFNFGYNLYYHGGWWGTDVNYSPETNTSVAIFTLNKEVRSKINPFLGKRIHEMIK